MSKQNKILIIEDEQETRQLYETILSDAGFTCDTAENGEKGLSKIKAGGYDLILLDLMMPTIDGIKILTEMKNSPPKIPNGPIVVATNISHVPAINEALRLGAKTCFVKSDLNPKQLVEKVKSILASA